MLNFLKRHLLTLLLLLLCGGAASVAYSLWKKNELNEASNQLLVQQLQEANQAKNEAAITRRVSKQLEEIAYQQKEVSDNQRREAIHQTEIAQEMRQRAEYQRELADASRIAANENFEEMKAQKKIADEQKEEAVRARLKADTLAQLALARSLGPQALTQYEAGSQQLAYLIGYTAWLFTDRNKGDVYQSEIFKLLLTISNTDRLWNVQNGGIRDMLTFSYGDSTYLFTSSQYGELTLWSLINSERIRLKKNLLANSAYDFRRILIAPDKSSAVVLSFSGHLIQVDMNYAIQVYDLGLKETFDMAWDGDKILVACRNGQLYHFSFDDKSTKLYYTHAVHPTALYSRNNEVYLGDEKGRLYQLMANGKMKTVWSKINQPITAIYKDQQEAISIGYRNGLVVYGNPEEGEMQELVGHLSTITSIKSRKGILYTSSYDGTVRSWNVNKNSNVINYTIIAEPKKWVYSFILVPNKQVMMTGNGDGSLYMIYTSPKKMAKALKQKLKRNFTQEEWNDYIGEISPYEKYM